VTFTRPTRQQGRDRVVALVENFRPQHGDIARPSSGYTEPALRTDFLDPLLEALGWDVTNALGKTQGRREVKVERSIELAGGEDDEAARGKPDYELRADGKPRLFVEAKKPSIRIRETPAAARQARRYGFSGSLPAAVLTNFTDPGVLRHPQRATRRGWRRLGAHTQADVPLDRVPLQVR
jgi:hypothetical protein